MKKVLPLMIVLLLMFVSVGLGADAVITDDIIVYIDGEELEVDYPPRIKEGRTLIAARPIFEAMGAQMEWDPENQVASAIKGDFRIDMPLGSKEATVNSEIMELEVAAEAYDGRTYVPLRFTGESFGGYVTWDGSTRTVSIFTPTEPDDPISGMQVELDPRVLATGGGETADITVILTCEDGGPLVGNEVWFNAWIQEEEDAKDRTDQLSDSSAMTDEEGKIVVTYETLPEDDHQFIEIKVDTMINESEFYEEMLLIVADEAVKVEGAVTDIYTGEILEGVSINFWSETQDLGVMATETDDKGLYAADLPLIDEGVINIWFELDGYGRDFIEIIPGEITEDALTIDMELIPLDYTVDIEVVVVDHFTGEPIEAVLVDIFQDGDSFSAKTDETGKVVFGDITPIGMFNAAVLGEESCDYTNFSTNFSELELDDLTVEIRMLPAVKLIDVESVYSTSSEMIYNEELEAEFCNRKISVKEGITVRELTDELQMEEYPYELDILVAEGGYGPPRPVNDEAELETGYNLGMRIVTEELSGFYNVTFAVQVE